jgi:UDP-2-acetamido-3-amino-2,3-dideoxy-glucuronate N-acetyltransferase
MSSSSGPAPRIAVAGCGAWGRNHVRTLGALSALAAVSDASAAAARTAAETAGVPALAWSDVLSDTSITGVVIAAPDALHAAMAGEALAAGKHVLAEKPMTMSVAAAEALAAEAERKGLVLMTGHILRYHPAFRRMQELIAEGAVGRMRHIAARRMHYAPGAPRQALWDLGPHDLSMILALAGRKPVSVRAAYSAHESDTPQAGMMALDFGDGLTAEITFSAITPVKLHQISVAGDRAQAVFEDSKPWPEKLALFRPGLERVRNPLAREGVDVAPGEPLAEELRAFIAAIAGGPMPPSCAREAIGVIAVLEAAARAAESGKAETP